MKTVTYDETRFVLVSIELTSSIANAMGFDSAFGTWKEECETWASVIEAAAPSEGESE